MDLMSMETQATGGSSRLFRRCLPWIFILIGILTVIAGFLHDVIFAGIPYQDPTPEMTARYDHHAGIASILRWSGVALCVFGMTGGVIRRATGTASVQLILAMILFASGAHAQTWSHAPWTGDADSGICNSLDYNVAVNTCGEAVTVNGVDFQSETASGTNFLIEGGGDTAAAGLSPIARGSNRNFSSAPVQVAPLILQSSSDKNNSI